MGCASSAPATGAPSRSDDAASVRHQPGKAEAKDVCASAAPAPTQPLFAEQNGAAHASAASLQQQGHAQQPAAASQPAGHGAISGRGDDSAQEDQRPSMRDWDLMGFGLPVAAQDPKARKGSLVEAAARSAMTMAPCSTLRESTALRIDKCQGGMFVNQYLVTKFLGRGACGKVFLCLNTCDLKLYAMKAVRKADIGLPPTPPPGPKPAGDYTDDILREIAIMKTMQHANVVSLYEIIDDPVGNKLLLIMEYMDGGPLLTREALDRREKMPESLARRALRDMIKALDYLHEHQVVHGDLKPENVLVSTTGVVKLSDFGCSKVFASNEYLDRCNGTPAFLAPEMMKPNSRFRGRPTDVYALGACLYTLVYGRIPFSAPDVCKLFQLVQEEPVTFPADTLVSPALTLLLQAMLCKNPRERITLAEMAKHPWVTLNGRFPLKLIRELKPGETSKLHDQLAEPGCTFAEANAQPDLLDVVSGLGLMEHTYKQGDTIMHQGDKGAYLIYITKGIVEVLLKKTKGSSKAAAPAGAAGAAVAAAPVAASLSPAADASPSGRADLSPSSLPGSRSAATTATLAAHGAGPMSSPAAAALHAGHAYRSSNLSPDFHSVPLTQAGAQAGRAGAGIGLVAASGVGVARVFSAGQMSKGLQVSKGSAESLPGTLLGAKRASSSVKESQEGSPISVVNGFQRMTPKGSQLGEGGSGRGEGHTVPGPGFALDVELQQAQFQQQLSRSSKKAAEFVTELQAAAAGNGGSLATAELLIAQRGPGCLVGEMAMLSKTGQRTATVRCATAVTARVILKDELQRFLDQNPVAKAQLKEQVMKRQAENNFVEALVKLANAGDALAPRVGQVVGMAVADTGEVQSSPLPMMVAGSSVVHTSAPMNTASIS